MDALSPDLQATLAEIDRRRQETLKYIAEREKLIAERENLAFKGAKLSRDRLLAPIIAVGGLFVGAASALAAIFAILLRH